MGGRRTRTACFFGFLASASGAARRAAPRHRSARGRAMGGIAAHGRPRGPPPATSRGRSAPARSAPLARLPDLLARPLPRPLRSDEGVARDGALGRVDLDEVLDLEAVPAQEADPVAGAHVELDARPVRPLEAVHPRLRAEEAR